MEGALAAAGVSHWELMNRREQPKRPRYADAAQQATYYCSAMPQVDCTALRYHCTKYPDINLCPKAFAEGRFPAGCTAKDFVRLEAKEQKVRRWQQT